MTTTKEGSFNDYDKMDKLKILWFSNTLVKKQDIGGTGTWLDAMSKGLVDTGKVQLANITTGKVKGLVRSDYGQIQQWIVPFSSMFDKNGLPEDRIVNYYLTAINDFEPDLIHIWGTESYAGLITARKMTNFPTLLEIQGLIGSIAKVYHGCLTFKEQFLCIGINEILTQSTIFQTKKRYSKWAVFEDEIISNHKNITVLSKFMEANVKAINPEANLFNNEIILREIFYKGNKWHFTGDPVIFASSAYPAPFKGLHIIIRAIEILIKKYPKIQLRIAGKNTMTGIKKDGYINWLIKEIKRANLASNIIWLGALNGEQLVEELSKCSLTVLPSYIESYGLAHAEAMAVGTPCVCSYNGGYSHLGEDEKTTLFFTPGDHIMCAFHIERLLNNRKLSESLSKMAMIKAFSRHDKEKIIGHQIEIYKEIIITEKNHE